MNFTNKVVLVTGGTGSFGRKFVKTILEKESPEKVIVFSRDELKQFEMAHEFGQIDNLRFFLGDIRDEQRLFRAFHGVDIVVHAAALKQVPMLEYNPLEAVKTNVLGAENIINAAIDQKVQQVLALSTDKAVNPCNLYGATKLCMEKLFVAGNSYSGEDGTKFSVVRYGNVVGSRGSVVPFFLEKRSSGMLPITDERMTRFWITLNQAVELVFNALEGMMGGEIFVPKIPSMRVMDLAQAIGPECRKEIVGIRPGEKIHEVLITEDESARAVDAGKFYVIRPLFNWWSEKNWQSGKSLAPGFKYSSDNNEDWLSPDKLCQMLESLEVKVPVRA